MPKAISAERWAAARALMRLEAPTQARVAAAMGIHLTTLATRSARENWAVLDFRRADIHAAHQELHTRLIDRFVRGAIDPEVPAEVTAIDAINAVNDPVVVEEAVDGTASETGRAARVSAMLVKHADLLLSQVERQGGVLTKPQLDAMLAMVRLAEKFEPIVEKEAAENQKKSDAEIAELYDRIDKRIETRAKHHARRLVARGDFGQGAGAGGGQLDAPGQRPAI